MRRSNISKILVVHYSLTPGGATRAAIADTESLRTQGFAVGFASERGEKEGDLHAKAISLHPLYFVDSGRYPRWLRYLLGVPLTTVLLLYYVARYRYDCLYVQHRQSGIPSTVVSWLTGAKYVFISRGELGERHRGRLATPLGRHIIAVSEQVKRNIVTYFRALADHVTVIPNATDTDVVKASDEAIRAWNERWAIAPEQAVVAYVAMLVEIKAHDVLLDAWRQVVDRYPEAVLVLAGDGPLKERLQTQCRRLGLTPYVRFLGYVEDVSIVYSRACLVVLSSRSEGLPRCILEAFAYGVPAVATAVSGTPELVQQEKTGLLVEPDNIEQLAQGIVRLLSDAPLRHRLGQVARQFVVDKHSAGKHELALGNFFRALEHT